MSAHIICSIFVVESNEDSNEESLAASSVIMPPAPSLATGTRVSGEASAPTFTNPSGPVSDDGSLDSSISLVDMPSSPSSPSSLSDDEIYEDSRTHLVPTAVSAHPGDVEYVVLYDTSSSSEEE